MYINSKAQRTNFTTNRGRDRQTVFCRVQIPFGVNITYGTQIVLVDSWNVCIKQFFYNEIQTKKYFRNKISIWN